MRITFRTILWIVILVVIGYAVYDVFFVIPKQPGALQSVSSGAAATTSADMSATTASTTASIPLTIVAVKELASSSPSVNAEYPQFPSLPASFNADIASATLSRIAEFKRESASTMQGRAASGDPRAELPASDYSFIGRWEPAQTNGRYVSFIMRFDSYTGGANENQELQTFDYDVRAGKEIGLSDLFGTTTGYLAKLSALSRTQLTASMNSASDGHAPTDMIIAGTQPTAADFKDFTFTDYALTIYFPKYAVAPGSFGEQHATFSWSELR